jgi:hypothetical protein
MVMDKKVSIYLDMELKARVGDFFFGFWINFSSYENKYRSANTGVHFVPMELLETVV